MELNSAFLAACFALALKILTISSIYYALTSVAVYFSIVYKILFVQKSPFSDQRVLLITAHPDDECMFFSPTIIELVKTNSVHILCTTTGDYYGQGSVRRKEILKSCEILGVAAGNVQLLDNKYFPDDPKIKWNEAVLRREIEYAIKEVDPHTILIFDEWGVSGHSNHITTGKVVREMLMDESLVTEGSTVYELETVNLLRKYISFLDLPFSIASDHLLFVSSIPAVLQAQRAMFAHKSQMEWFRYLYIYFSRYMIMNTFIKVNV